MPARIEFRPARLCRTAIAACAIALVACSESPVEPLESGGPPSLSSSRPGRYVPGRVLVRFRTGADEAALARAQGAELEKTVALRVRILRVAPGREVAVARALSRRPDVEFAEPDWLRTVDDPTCPGCTLPNDPLFGYKWDLHNDGAIESSAGDVLAATGAVDADVDWLEAFDQLGPGFSGAARVGILDTGVRASHADLAGRVVAQYDFYNDDPDASDDQGHGTHVSGIAAARGGDGSGLAGVAWGPNIGLVVAKVCTPTFFGLNAECPSSALAAGITWAVDQGANVLNISLGGTESSQTEQLALQYARAHDVLRAALTPLNYRNLDDLPQFKGINTTTEFLTRHVFDLVADAARKGELGRDGRELKSIRVTVAESPVARAWYEAPLW